MANFIYNQYYAHLHKGSVDWSTATVKLILLADTYTPDKDLHEFYSEISAHELPELGGYLTGGGTLTVTTAVDTTNDNFDINLGSYTWDPATFATRYGVVVIDTGNPATSPLYMLVDFGKLEQPNGEPFPVNFTDPAGINNTPET